MIFTWLQYCFLTAKAKLSKLFYRLVYNLQKPSDMNKLKDSDPELDQEVIKQNRALLEIVNKTMNKVPLDIRDVDIKSEFERKSFLKSRISRK